MQTAPLPCPAGFSSGAWSGPRASSASLRSVPSDAALPAGWWLIPAVLGGAGCWIALFVSLFG